MVRVTTAVMVSTRVWIVLLGAGLHHAYGCKVGSDGEPSRFERVPENLEPGTHVLLFEVQGTSQLTLRPVDKDEDFTELFEPVLLSNNTGGVLVSQPLTSLMRRAPPVSVVKFRVSCESSTPFTGSDSLLITLYIEDVNDHRPQFVGEPYQVTVDELTPRGMVIYDLVVAKDGDRANTANSDIYYWISSGNEDLKFSLSPLLRGGTAVVLDKPFDFENGDRELNLTITASDRGSPAHLSRARLTITVSDGDDQPPMFTSAVYRAQVTEYPGPQMRSLRLLVITRPPILAYDGDLAIDQPLGYHIRSGNAAGHFSMDPGTGALTLVKTLDREQLDNDVVSLTIEAYQKDDRSKSARATVLVTVTDLNDNRPDFVVDRYNISIIENLLHGFSIVQVHATDADQGNNSKFTYVLDDPSGTFGLDPVTGWLTVADQSKLDREVRSQLKLNIYADELTPNVLRRQTRSVTRVIINLLDSNDNNPAFVPTNTYQFVVEGNSSVGRIIGKVLATDPDEGDNGRITYSFENSTSAGGRPVFSVSPTGGELLQLRPTPAGSYVLFVRGQDSPAAGGQTRSALAVVTVLVRVHNVRPPRISPGQRIWVGKDVQPGSRVGQLIVDDPDGDDLTFRLRDESVPFEVEANTGYIQVSAPLNTSDQSSYSLAIDVTDGTHLATSMIDIFIVAENAQESFKSASLTFEVLENSSNVTIGRLIAEPHRPVQYLKAQILNPMLNDTFLVTSTGELRLLSPLDFEKRHQLSFTVVLEYQHDGQKHVRAVALTLNVGDVNDNPPRFSSRHYRAVVGSAVGVGDLISVTPAIRVSDPDRVPSRLTFRLRAARGHDCAAFKVSQLALLSVAEATFQRGVYECELEVMDEDGMGSTSLLTVQVEADADDGDITKLTARQTAPAPVSDMKSSGTTIRSVNENRPHEELATASAGDSLPEEAVEGRDFRSRALAESALTLAQLLSDVGNYSGVIRAAVRIPTVLPTGAVIYRLPQEVSLRPLPDGGLATHVLNGSGDVVEMWPQGVVGRSSSKSKHFAVDFENRVVRVARPLEEAGKVVVRLQSQEDNKRKDVLILMVDVVLVPRPRLARDALSFDLDEGEYVDKRVGLVRLMSSATNTRVVFSIPDGISSYRVSQDGAVFLSGSVDREKSAVVRIPVQVCPQLCVDIASKLPLEESVQDACRTSCDVVNVTVTVGDLNDNDPVFTGVSDVASAPRGVQNEPDVPYAVYKMKTPAQLAAGVVVANISAYDADSDRLSGGAVRFKILTPGDDFMIGAESGRVTTARRLTHPAGSVRRITLVAYDLGSPSRRAFAVLELTSTAGGRVEAVRAFDRAEYSVSVAENQPVTRTPLQWRVEPAVSDRRWTVRVVNATGRLPRLSVSIVNDSLLQIDGTLDFEQTQELWLLVTTNTPSDAVGASNSAGVDRPLDAPPAVPRRAGSSASSGALLYNEAVIRVDVTDVNDNAPTFNVSVVPVIVGVPYDAGYGYDVMRAKASDMDAGDNVTYTIDVADANVRSMYSIDPARGQMWLLRRADQLPQRIHRLQVTATDSANNTDELPVMIYVLDSRDMMVVMLNQTSEKVRQSRDRIASRLSRLVAGDVRIVRVAAHTDGRRVDDRYSDVWLYALDPATRTLLASRDLLARLEAGLPTEALGADADLGVRLAGMWPAADETRGFYTNLKFIIVGLSLIIFLLMSLTLAVLCCKSCRRGQNKTSPYPPLTMTPPASGYSSTPPPATGHTDVTNGNASMKSLRARGEMVEKRPRRTTELGLVLEAPLYSKPSRRLSATQVAPGHYVADAHQLSQTLVRRPAAPASHRRYGSLNYPAGSRPAGQLTSGQLTSGQLTAGQLTAGQLTAGQLTAGQLTAGQLTAGQLTHVPSPERRPLSGANVRRQSATNSLGDGTEVGVATMSFCSESPSELPAVDYGKRPRPARLAPPSPRTPADTTYPDSLNPRQLTPPIGHLRTDSTDTRGEEFLDSLEPNRFLRTWSVNR